MNAGTRSDLGGQLLVGAATGAAVSACLGLWILGRTLPLNTLGAQASTVLGFAILVVYALPGLLAGAAATGVWSLLRGGRTRAFAPAAAFVLVSMGAWVLRGRVEVVAAPAAHSLLGAAIALALVILGARLLSGRGGRMLVLAWIAIVGLVFAMGFLGAHRDAPRDPRALDALRASDRPSAPVVVIGLDGVEPEILEAMRAAGAVPNLDRLWKEGAVSPMQSMEPTWSPPIWTSIWTGRMPRDHGITFFLSEGTYRVPGAEGEVVLPRIFGLQRIAAQVLDERVVPVTSELRRATAVWEAAGLAERTSVLANRLVSWPVQPLRGVEFSNRLLLDETDLPALAFPDSAFGVAREALDAVEPLADPALDAAPWLAIQLARERVLWRLAAEASERRGADLTIVYTHLIDSAQHRYLKYHWTDRFRFAPEPENVARFGGAISATYRAVDAMVGEVLSILGPRHRVLIVSDHGVRPNLQIDRDVPEPVGARRMPPAPLDEVSGVHGDAPDGVFCLYGPGVRPGAPAQVPHVLEMAPLVLHLLGLPVPDDLERTSPLVGDPGLVADLTPLRRVGSFEGLLPRRIRTQETAADAQILEQLRALGYIE